ncbi:hypothetical protein FALBO_15494 [Fusarium albosuccineum]|uniref:Uncharacterized protein n=1 Tax=Fusarium albosuccineum TaxID=1237068 RepID=A0A8H4NYM4_9HYPO|nr:hypothetical protein FALBO_15494 [Fusarium albosuccineum]
MLPEPAAIAPEFISTFYIDDACIDAVVAGALSVGNAMGGTQDAVRDVIHLAINKYISARLVADLQIARQGFILRSSFVEAFPGLSLDISQGTTVHQVRQEDMILCFFNPGPDPTEKTVDVTISQPPHQQGFRVTKLAAGYVTPTFDINPFRKTQAEGTSPQPVVDKMWEKDKPSTIPTIDEPIIDWTIGILFPSTIAKASRAVAKEILKDEFQELSNDSESLYLAVHLQDRPSSLVIPFSVPPGRSSTTRQLFPDQIGDGAHGPATANPKGSAVTHTDPEGHLVKAMALSQEKTRLPNDWEVHTFQIGVPLGDCAIHLLVKNAVRYKHGVEFKVPDSTKEKTKKTDVPLFRLPMFRWIVELTEKDLSVHTDKKKTTQPSSSTEATTTMDRDHAYNSILYCPIWLRPTKAGVAPGAPNILVDDEHRIWLTDGTVWPLDLKVENNKNDKKDWSRLAPPFKVVHGQDTLIGAGLFTQIPVCDKKPGKLWWADKKHNAQSVVEGYIKKRQGEGPSFDDKRPVFICIRSNGYAFSSKKPAVPPKQHCTPDNYVSIMAMIIWKTTDGIHISHLCGGDAHAVTEELILNFIKKSGSGGYQDPEYWPIEVMKASHHGARSSTPVELVMAARPSKFIISAGQSHGHPSM